MSEALKRQLAKLIATRLMTWLVSKAAFFAWGPANVLASFLIEKLMVKAIEETFLGGMIAYIFIDTRKDLNAVEKIIKEINQQTEGITPEQMDEYDKRLAEAGRDLIRYATIG